DPGDSRDTVAGEGKGVNLDLYWTPPINFRIGRINNARIRAAANAAADTEPKSLGSGIVLKKPAVQPAIMSPTAIDQNQTPIIRPTILAGARFVTTLSPTGIRDN